MDEGEKTTELHDVRATALRFEQSWSLITTVTLSDPQRLLLWWDKIQKKSINTVMDRRKDTMTSDGKDSEKQLRLCPVFIAGSLSLTLF